MKIDPYRNDFRSPAPLRVDLRLVASGGAMNLSIVAARSFRDLFWETDYSPTLMVSTSYKMGMTTSSEDLAGSAAQESQATLLSILHSRSCADSRHCRWYRQRFRALIIQHDVESKVI